MLEVAVALLVHIKVVVLPAVHVQILTVSYVTLSVAVNVSVDSILWEVLVVFVLITVKNVLMAPLARHVNLHIYSKVVNASLRVMVRVLLLMPVERFSLVMLDVRPVS
jgi:hypothetical protein